MTTLVKMCLWAFLIVGLGAMLFLGYQAGMGIVQDWEDLAGSGPTPQVSAADLALMGGVLFAVLLTLAAGLRQTLRMRAKNVKAKGTGPKTLSYPERPKPKNVVRAGF